MSKLKPVSEIARKFLSKLGETPEEHQKQVLLAKTYTTSNDTKRKPRTVADIRREWLKDENREVEKKLGYHIPIAELAAAVAAHATSHLEPTWISVAYTMFIESRTCRHCGRTHEAMQHPYVFLEQRPERDNGTHPRKFTPVSLFSYDDLPHHVVREFTSVSMCHVCFGERPCHPQNLVTATLPVHTVTSVPAADSQVSVTLNMNPSSGSSALRRPQLLPVVTLN